MNRPPLLSELHAQTYWQHPAQRKCFTQSLTRRLFSTLRPKKTTELVHYDAQLTKWRLVQNWHHQQVRLFQKHLLYHHQPRGSNRSNQQKEHCSTKKVQPHGRNKKMTRKPPRIPKHLLELPSIVEEALSSSFCRHTIGSPNEATMPLRSSF